MKIPVAADGVEAGSFAWSWLCNIAMPLKDATGMTHEQANRAAAKLMRHLFDIDMTTAQEWQRFEREWAATASALPVGRGLREALTRWHERKSNDSAESILLASAVHDFLAAAEAAPSERGAAEPCEETLRAMWKAYGEDRAPAEEDLFSMGRVYRAAIGAERGGTGRAVMKEIQWPEPMLRDDSSDGYTSGHNECLAACKAAVEASRGTLTEDAARLLYRLINRMPEAAYQRFVRDDPEMRAWWMAQLDVSGFGDTALRTQADAGKEGV